MFKYRRAISPSNLRPEQRFIRSIQAPDQVVKDKLTGKWRVSSGAFSPSGKDACLSGDLEQLIVDDHLDPMAFQPSVKNAVAVIALHVGEIRDQGLAVEHQPIAVNWYHGGVRGIKKPKQKENLRLAALELQPVDQVVAERLFQAKQDRLRENQDDKSDFGPL